MQIHIPSINQYPCHHLIVNITLHYRAATQVSGISSGRRAISRAAHDDCHDAASNASSAASHAASAASDSRRIEASRAFAAVIVATFPAAYKSGSASFASSARVRHLIWQVTLRRLSPAFVTAPTPPEPPRAPADRPCAEPARPSRAAAHAPPTTRDNRPGRHRTSAPCHRPPATTVRHEFHQMRIVRDQQDSAFKIRQGLHQSLTRIDVQMIGRFVQDQQLRRVTGSQRQQQPGFFTAG